jgi:hypothetical protein
VFALLPPLPLSRLRADAARGDFPTRVGQPISRCDRRHYLLLLPRQWTKNWSKKPQSVGARKQKRIPFTHVQI